MNKSGKQQHGSGMCGKWMIGLLIIGGIFYLTRSGGYELTTAWPLLVLLLCPVMHLFMHRGHGQQHHDNAEKQTGNDFDKGKRP